MITAAQDQGWRPRWAWTLYRASLFCLPGIGFGVLKMTTGRDLGGGLQPSWLLLAGAMLLQVPELLAFLRSRVRSWLPVVGPILGGVLLSLLGIWVARAQEPLTLVVWRYFKQVIQLLIMGSFVLVPAYFLVRGRTLAAMAAPLAWGAVAQVFYGVLQGIHFYHPLSVMVFLESVFTSNPAILSGSEQLYLGDTLQNIPRLRGTACEPLYLGNYLLLMLPLVGLTNWPRRGRNLAAAGLAVLLCLTWSRGSWLAAIAGSLFLLVFAPRARVDLQWRRLGRNLALGVGLMVVLVVLGAVTGREEVWLPWRRMQQVFSAVDWSNLTRIYSMQAAWRAFLLSPVVGIGWGQFGFHFAAVVDPLGMQAMFSWPVVNNLPLAILCETGVVGAGAFVWLVGRLARSIVRAMRRSAESQRRALLLLSAGTYAVWLQLLTFSQYNLPHIWVGLGLIAGTLARPDTAAEEIRR